MSNKLNELRDALDATYPIPDSPHESVKQRARENRTAFIQGWQQKQAATEAAKATGTAELPPLPEMESVADMPHAQKVPPDWDDDYTSIWQKWQVSERNKMQWRAYALQLRSALAATAAPVAEIEPCGGCGNSDPDKRCIGCTHQFGQVAPECTFSEDEIYDIERCLRTGVTMGYTKKKGAEKALAIFNAATNRSQP